MGKTTTYVLIGAAVLVVVVLLARSNSQTVRAGNNLGTVGGALVGAGSLYKAVAGNSGDYEPDMARGSDLVM